MEVIAYIVLAAMLLIPFMPAGKDWLDRLAQWEYERKFEE